MEKQEINLIYDHNSELNVLARRQDQSFLWSVVIAVSLLMIVVGGLALIKSPTILKYRNEKYNFSMMYPSSWRMMENPGGLNLSAVAFVAPGYQVGQKKFPDTFTVIFKPLQEQVSFERFTQTAIQTFTQTYGGRIKIVESRPARVAGQLAHRFSFEHADEKITARFLVLWTYDRERKQVIDFTYMANKESFHAHLADVENMIKSFRFL